MIAMMGDAAPLAHAVIDYVGMGEALDRMLSVAESEDGRGRDEAKRRERGHHDSEPEAESMRQCRQHRVLICSRPCKPEPRAA
jgi:hypothetical protein